MPASRSARIHPRGYRPADWRRGNLVTAPLIDFQNVMLYRGDKIALDGITLSINVGEHVAILGPNGSGKSSLIKAITRECYPLQSDDGPPMRILGKEAWNVFDLRV